MTAKDNEQLVTIGSKYRVLSTAGESQITSVGEFRGYAALSDESALALKLDESHGQDAGSVRFIPFRAIAMIDVLVLAPKEAVEKKDDNRVYYR